MNKDEKELRKQKAIDRDKNRKRNIQQPTKRLGKNKMLGMIYRLAMKLNLDHTTISGNEVLMDGKVNQVLDNQKILDKKLNQIVNKLRVDMRDKGLNLKHVGDVLGESDYKKKSDREETRALAKLQESKPESPGGEKEGAQRLPNPNAKPKNASSENPTNP